MTAEELFLAAEHVHRATLAATVAATTTGQLGHHAFGVHAAGQHVAVIAIGCNDLIALLGRHLQADDDGLLANVQVTEAADEAHAIKLAGFFFEPADH